MEPPKNSLVFQVPKRHYRRGRPGHLGDRAHRAGGLRGRAWSGDEPKG
jgi:hypothetical protein